ncbi:MAG: HDIG domain-containing protein [Phycisphaeraceae bacterium]|nr:HDIG domain-containing protein [Phycisphaeraceae bacterium]
MARDSTKSVSRVESLSRSVRSRRRDLADRLLQEEGIKDRMIDALTDRTAAWGLVVAVLFAVVCSALVHTSRNQPLVAVGRIMDETRLVRIPLSLEDRAQTQRVRAAVRDATPRVYVADLPTIERVTQSIEFLPRALASAEDLESVDATIRRQFNLTPELLAAVKAEAVEGEPSGAWITKVRNLTALLKRRPFLDQQTYQRSVQEGTHQTVRLVIGQGESLQLYRGEVVNIDDRSLSDVVTILAREAGFTGQSRDLVVRRLLSEPRPTFTYDAATTTKDQNEAAESVAPVVVVSPVGQVIFQRGERLTQAQADLFSAELSHYASNAEFWQRWLRFTSVITAVAAVTLAISGYTVLFCPRIRSKVSRMVGVALILAGGLAASCWLTAAMPQFRSVTTVTPTVFVAMLMCIAYDRRSALAYGLLHGLLACVALRESVGTMAVMIAGISCVVWTLREIRDRNSLFRTSIFAAVGVSSATVIFSLIQRPLVDGTPIEVVTDAVLVAGGMVIAGGVALFLLPLLERAFNITTGLTLMELRDPKQPLLRELQQRAPGTYNHSLSVASIAESAAQAIGADSLLTYVGALYHDVGKMNKPEYFVENQHPGANKHDKLNPAMSLLIIVGHVKDGMELAREFGLPRSLQHFIEAHHGTTLVEFFYHRARQMAAHQGARPEQEADTVYLPDEFEYRYPGPRPRTKECAILMVADAVESAARSLDDPNPGSIEKLVRAIAHKRLMDGQFDDCELTLRELNLIVEAITRTVSSMYHGRISYPGEPQRGEGPEDFAPAGERGTFDPTATQPPVSLPPSSPPPTHPQRLARG